ncbi:rhamnulokinase [Xylanimonas protaetiae]|uniref:Rhamnulokinase n=1 Tax=Xylanimonas protaetiae TaxID=2509457 RepID=A0A4P6FEE6_9MICO|nr:rhamnulokinase family protein [Xylanimonas protaetiae]QAY68978.1 rhamnulokinase [Xylanimonas protaetiae]
MVRTPTTLTAFAAVDLGATSGRVMLGLVRDAATVDLVETGRFPNGPVTAPDGESLHWDVLRLWEGVVDGLREAGRVAATHGVELSGVGVDSWAVDYGLVGDDEHLVRPARCYRDPRFLDVADGVYERVPASEHYAVNGLQHLPFTTEFQLVDEVTGGAGEAFAAARTLLLIPDLITFWLSGRRVAEVTNASTTGLLDARARTWSSALLGRLAAEYPGLGRLPALLPELVEAGTVVGELGPWVRARTGLGPVPVVAVASHDTAAAVVGTPLPARQGDEVAAYVSSGTWSLVGLELDAPVLTEASRAAGFTNELGLDGTVRYLHNVMGLWVLDECRREWARTGDPVDLGELLAAAAAEPGGRTVVDLDDPAFLAPGDMPRRVAHAAARAGQPVPATRAQTARAVLDSLAAAYARTIHQAAALAGVRVTQVHVVGGGSRNALLCRLTADATGLPVVAGPVEAAALGNVLVQARAVGVLVDDDVDDDGGPRGLGGLRDVVAASSDLVRIDPARIDPAR